MGACSPPLRCVGCGHPDDEHGDYGCKWGCAWGACVNDPQAQRGVHSTDIFEKPPFPEDPRDAALEKAEAALREILGGAIAMKWVDDENRINEALTTIKTVHKGE